MNILKAFGFILASFIILISLIIFLSLRSQHKPIINHTVPSVVKKITQQPQMINSAFTTGIDNLVTNSLDQSKGKYSIIVMNMKTNEIYSQNPDRIYLSASLYKLWVMAGVYQEISEGKLKKTDTLTGTVKDLNKSFNIASNEAELTTGTISSTIDDALTKAITFSDNYSALLLTKKLGIKTLDAFLKKEGLYSSKTGSPPTTTASDIALFYSKLYKKELVNRLSSDEMISLLKRQAINDRIPKYLPEGVSVAHKTGELNDFKHDAGIVYTPKGDYILVMFSQTDDPQTAAENIAELSKQIYLHYLDTN